MSIEWRWPHMRKSQINDTGSNLQRRSVLNLIAGILGHALTAYVVSRWFALPLGLRYSGTGWTVIAVACVLCLLSLVYLGMACLMWFRYRLGLPLGESTRLKTLHYEEDKNQLAVVWHAGGLWLTSEQVDADREIG